MLAHYKLKVAQDERITSLFASFAVQKCFLVCIVWDKQTKKVTELLIYKENPQTKVHEKISDLKTLHYTVNADMAILLKEFTKQHNLIVTH